MEEIEKIRKNFENNLKMINQVVNIGSDIGDILLDFLKGLEGKYPEAPVFKQEMSKGIKFINQIRGHESLKDKYSIIYNQAIVLVVSSFESFMNDVFRGSVDRFPDFIEWPEKKRLSFDATILNYSYPSVGDLVLKSLKGEMNFQDLQSTMRFLKEYLKADIDLNKESKDKIILYQSLRNVIIHNFGIIDDGFLRQIRETSFSSGYSLNDKVEISEAMYKDVVKVFSDFSELICNFLEKRFCEIYVN